MDPLQDLFREIGNGSTSRGGEGAGGPKDPSPDVGGGMEGWFFMGAVELAALARGYE